MSVRKENGNTFANGEDLKKDASRTQVPDQTSFTPELMFKMNKKIAQLTKVVYGLNTRGEELEGQLVLSRENEDKTKSQNNELQLRVNTLKSKIECEMAKIKDAECQANQTQLWKTECENLQRRLESEGGGGDTKILLGRARDEIEQLRVREKNIQHDLDQAKHTISNLKAHHDFMMRERDAQQEMEKEKIVLECNTQIAELEGRYKSEVRRAADDLEVIAEECAILRRRSVSLDGDGAIRQQLNYEQERQDIVKKLRQQTVEAGELRSEIIDLQRKLHQANEETRRLDERWENSTRLFSERYESRINDLSVKCDMLQKIDTEREVEYRNKLSSKISEISHDRDVIDETHKSEIRTLKQQKEKLESEVAAVRQLADKTNRDYVETVQNLQLELSQKIADLDLKSKNFKIRLNMLEGKNKQLAQEKIEIQQELDNEKERYRHHKMSHIQTNANALKELTVRLQEMEQTEQHLSENVSCLTAANDGLNLQMEDLQRQLREKDREADDRVDEEKQNIESRIRVQLESVWMDKLKNKNVELDHEIQKVEDVWKKKEATMTREFENLNNALESARQRNEESRKNIREMRMQELESGKKHAALQSLVTALKKDIEAANRRRNDMETQCRKQQIDIDKLTEKISTEQELSAKVKRELDAVKKDSMRQSRDLDESRKKNAQHTELEIKLQDFRRQLREKEAQVESIKVDFEYSKNERDLCKSKIQRLETELKTVEQKCDNLQRQNSLKNSDESKKVLDVETQMKRLQDSCRNKDAEIAELQTTLQSIDDERDEEMKIVQDALDEAAQEREDLLTTFQKELESANTKNTAREQQMLQDFEWKLRETEKDNKAKLQETESQSKTRLDTVRSMVESELSDSLLKVAEEKKSADEMMSEVAHLKSYAAEVVQLRGVTFEFQKALRAASRETESLKIKHILCEEEIKNLKKGAQTKQNTLNRKKPNDDEDFKKKLDNAKQLINTEWEKRLNDECCQLKSDLENSHERKKTIAVDVITDKYETEIKALKKTHDAKQNELNEEITNLKVMMSEKDNSHDRDMDELSTSTDRDIWELRSKLQKLDDASYNKEENLIQKHNEEIESTRTIYEDKIRELTAQLQVNEELQETISNLNEQHDEKIDHIERQHREVLENLEQEHEVEKQRIKQQSQLENQDANEKTVRQLEDQLAETFSQCQLYRNTLETTKQALSSREDNINNLKKELSHVQSINASSSSLEKLHNSSTDSRASPKQTARSNSCSDDSQNETQKGSNNILVKVFGNGWFGPSKTKDSVRRGSNPSK